MGRQIVKNPQTNRYQIFSSIVDAFILDDEFTREELTDFWREQYGESSMVSFETRMVELHVNTEQNRKDWECAKMWDTHQAEHGPKTRKPDVCQICKDILSEENKK